MTLTAVNLPQAEEGGILDFDIKAALKELPEKPGVYIMKDIDDVTIYVGKAKILKNRVRQYFQNSSKHSQKVRSMTANIHHFEYIVTNSEVEALILENNLIKKFEPKYNIMLRDDKTYPYIKVTLNEKYPRVFMTRQHKKDKAKYYGPYTSSYAVKEMIDTVLGIFPLRRCLKKFPRDMGKERPCLNYHIKKCKAPCNNLISEEEYNKIVASAIDFLNGNNAGVIKELEKMMLEYSDNMEFEKAAEYRDRIKSIKKLDEKQIIESSDLEDKDVIALVFPDTDALLQIFFVRGGKITGREHFLLQDVDGTSRSELMGQFLKRYYSGTPFIPKEILLSEEAEDKETIESWLSEIKQKKVTVTVPKKGEKHKLTEMAYDNARMLMEKFGEEMKREQKRTIGALEEIKAVTGIKKLNRIESYDISNTYGIESVGAMVVFENGLPKKSDYRKFKIKYVVGANDYASMEEVLRRRLMRFLNKESGKGFEILPDAIFVDGGKGHITSVQKVLDELGISVNVVGMVKDDHHRTRGIIYNDEEIYLKPESEGFKLVTRIQDEVHRFAITYHRRLREKKQVKSVLDDIKGIGDVRRKALMRHFGSIEKIRDAQKSELESVEGMNSLSANAVYNFFHR